MEVKINQGDRDKVRSDILFAELSALFIDVEADFIQTLCEETCAQGLMIDRSGLDFLIDQLLCESPNHLKNPSSNRRNQMIDVCEKYKYIRDIFPDIGPKYLMEYLTKNCDSPRESWQNTYNFIKFFIISHYYPKIDDYIERLERTEQIRCLTTDFQIDDFLEIFPDPFKYFEDKNRKCKFNYIVLDFLKKLFNRHQVRTIEKFYRNNKYNASLASKELANLKPDIKNRRKMMHRQTDNINLLQEFAFIRNRKFIQKYMDESRARDIELTRRFEKLNFPLKCEYCFEKECLPDECCTCDKGHVFCVDCTSQGIDSLLANDGKATLKCFTNCDSKISAAGLQKILSFLKITPIMDKQQIDRPKINAKNLISCPFCQFASTPSIQNNIFKCLNPNCLTEICCICKKRNHAPYPCKKTKKSVGLRLPLPPKESRREVDLNANHLPARRYLLPPVRARDVPKKCLLIDLDETLVHCSLKPINNADFVVYVGDVGPDVYYVLKRPHVDEFLQRMGELYECVLFTASVAEYANPIVNLLDRWGVFRARLFRNSCVSQNGHFVKDLKRLGRDLQRVAILDDRPSSYSFQPDNGVSITPWCGDKTDSKLLDLIPFFEELSKVDNVYSMLCNRQRK